MAFRRRMTRRSSRKNFRRGGRVHSKNFIHPMNMRGGYRI